MLRLTLALLLTGCAQTPTPPPAPQAAREPTSPADPASHLRAATDHPDRPAAARARDADRRPVEVLAFLGIRPGMHVAELMTGGGWYAEILARAVGPSGKVYAQNNRFVLEKFAEEEWSARLARLSLPHLVRVDSELVPLELPAKDLDAVLMILFYHDTYWMEVDRAAMNRAVFDALAPGGVYGIVDHHAETGSGSRDVKSLHRVDVAIVKQEVLAAGFLLEAESDLLRHPEDDRTQNVFDEAIRGKTDRFVLRFRKPAR